MHAILRHLTGRTVLEVGCGSGFLAGKMSARHQVTAVDIVIDPALLATYPDVQFAVGTMERLPFPDRSFDTVVCTHTLEHAREIITAVGELRRVARKRLILAVPKQRPYRYTFDLHLHFFPYESSLLGLMHRRGWVNSCREIGGDLFYMEDPLKPMAEVGARDQTGASVGSETGGNDMRPEDGNPCLVTRRKL